MFRIKFNQNVVLWNLLYWLYNDRRGEWTSNRWFSDLRTYELEIGGLEGIHIDINGNFQESHFMHTKTMLNLNNAFYRLLKGKPIVYVYIFGGLNSHLILERKGSELVVRAKGDKFKNFDEQHCNWVQATEEVVQAVRTLRSVYEQAAGIISPAETQKFMDLAFSPTVSSENLKKFAIEWLINSNNYHFGKEIKIVEIDDEDESVAKDKASIYIKNKTENYFPIMNNFQWQPLESEWRDYLKKYPETQEELKQVMLKLTEKDLNEYRIANNREPYKGYTPF
jgi:hypothetical protein